jgi:hypothetical protein
MGSKLLSVALAFSILAAPVQALAGVSTSPTTPPPPLPVYEQTPLPGAGYIWIPGYWAWGDNDYYWVPGVWAQAPAPGLLWTPGYWAYRNGAYSWTDGYWGAHIGFYGGVAYGFGYDGSGYSGGYWSRGAFNYNIAVSKIPMVVQNTYSQIIVLNTTAGAAVSYNGGPAGSKAKPTPVEIAATEDKLVSPTSAQQQHHRTACANRDLRVSVNHGRPMLAALSTPATFTDHGVTAAPAETSGCGAIRFSDPEKIRAAYVSNKPAAPKTADAGKAPVKPEANAKEDANSAGGVFKMSILDFLLGKENATIFPHGNAEK